MGKSVLFSGFEPKSLTSTCITNRTMKSVGNPPSASQSTVGARWKILSYRWNLVRSRMCLSKRSVAVDGHQLVRIRSKFSHLSDLTEQNLQDDEVNDYEIVVDFESLEDDDREVGDRFIPISPRQTLTANALCRTEIRNVDMISNNALLRSPLTSKRWPRISRLLRSASQSARYKYNSSSYLLVHRLTDVEAKLKDTEKDNEEAKKEQKRARDAFVALKKKR